MKPTSGRCENPSAELLPIYALQALPPSDATAVEAHVAACPECRHEVDALLPVVEAFVTWPTDVLRPPAPLWERLAHRISADGEPAATEASGWREPEWEEVAPGISCKLLATDAERDRVSMLVRLAPGVAYPGHRHGGIEELHLLGGDLLVDDKLLHPGDYLRSEPGTTDTRVWTESGCTCVLITSPSDELR